MSPLPSSGQGLEAMLQGDPVVRIWRTQSAMEEGSRMARAPAPGGASDTWRRLLSCEVAPGTRAAMGRVPGSYAWDAVVLEGPHAGCRGVVGPRDFRTASTPQSPLPPGAAGAPPPARPREEPRAEKAAAWVLWDRTIETVFVESGEPPVDSWRRIITADTQWDCEAAKQKNMEGYDRIADRVVARVDRLRRLGRAQVRVVSIPQADGVDLLISGATPEGRRTVRVEVRMHCYPEGHDPGR